MSFDDNKYYIIC